MKLGHSTLRRKRDWTDTKKPFAAKPSAWLHQAKHLGIDDFFYFFRDVDGMEFTVLQKASVASVVSGKTILPFKRKRGCVFAS